MKTPELTKLSSSNLVQFLKFVRKMLDLNHTLLRWLPLIQYNTLTVYRCSYVNSSLDTATSQN